MNAFDYLDPYFKMGTKTDIFLYTEGTPNGLKISIALEELGLEYEVRDKNLPEPPREY